MLAGDTRAEIWIKPLLEDQRPAGHFGRLILMPGAKAPITVVPKSRQVCNCLNIHEDTIQTSLQQCSGSEDERLSALQSRLACGTECGSCLPELRRLVRANPLEPVHPSA